MKKIVLLGILCLSMPLLIIGSSPDSFNLNDTLKQTSNLPLLRAKGAKVFKDNTLLGKDEVLSLLTVTPVMAKKYDKGTNLRSTGIIMIVSGAAAMVGGVALAVSGIEKKTEDSYYYTYQYTEFGDNYYIGLIIGTLGELLLDGGIACSIVGKVIIKKSVSGYNDIVKKSAFMPRKINYQAGLLANGNIGLKIKF